MCGNRNMKASKLIDSNNHHQQLFTSKVELYLKSQFTMKFICVGACLLAFVVSISSAYPAEGDNAEEYDLGQYEGKRML